MEPREHLVRNATESLLHYGCAPTTFEFVQDDIFRYLARREHGFDIVLCLGFLYHTYKHPELFALVRKLDPQAIVIDSQVHKAEGMLVAVRRDSKAKDGEAAEDETSLRGKTWVGMPTPALLEALVVYYGFVPEAVDWQPILSDGNYSDAKDYLNGNRITLICRKRDSDDG